MANETKRARKRIILFISRRERPLFDRICKKNKTPPRFNPALPLKQKHFPKDLFIKRFKNDLFIVERVWFLIIQLKGNER